MMPIRRYAVAALSCCVGSLLALGLGELVARMCWSPADVSVKIGVGRQPFMAGVMEATSDPFCAFVYKPDLHPSDQPDVYTNSRRFHDYDRYPEARTSGKFRVLVTGDSVAAGHATKLDYSVPKLLELELNLDVLANLSISPPPFLGEFAREELGAVLSRDAGEASASEFADGAYPRRVEVLNAAVPGYSLVEQPSYYATYCARYKPDLVLLGICLNDRGTYLQTLDGGELVMQQTNYLGLKSWEAALGRELQRTLVFHSSLFAILQKRLGEWCLRRGRGDLVANYLLGNEPVSELFDRVIAAYRSHDVPVVVAVFPYFDGRLLQERYRYGHADEHDWWIDQCKRHGLTNLLEATRPGDFYVDLLPAVSGVDGGQLATQFRENDNHGQDGRPPGKLITDPVHGNAVAHQKIALFLARALRPVIRLLESRGRRAGAG